LKKYLYDKGKSHAARWEETGEILYVRGLINAMLGVEAIRTGQEKFGKKPLTGEQVRWGRENLNLTAERLKQLASRTSCNRSRSRAPITKARGRQKMEDRVGLDHGRRFHYRAHGLAVDHLLQHSDGLIQLLVG
jgi:hypothetical protein